MLEVGVEQLVGEDEGVGSLGASFSRDFKPLQIRRSLGEAEQMLQSAEGIVAAR